MCCFPKISVVAANGRNMAHFSEDGMPGMDFFMNFQTVTINLKDMFIRVVPREEKITIK